jgi:hypothetical protein
LEVPKPRQLTATAGQRSYSASSAGIVAATGEKRN